MERPIQERKQFNAPLAAPFGTLEDRTLDTRKPGLKDNPGPGDYNVPSSTMVVSADQHAIFKSMSKRPDNLSSDPKFPSPVAYNAGDFHSMGKPTLQGGSPNNVLVLTRAE